MRYEEYIGTRIPRRLADRIRALARRDYNGVSATIRRLITRGLDQESVKVRRVRPKHVREDD